MSLLERAVTALTPLVDDVYVSVRSGQEGDSLRARYRHIVDAEGLSGPGGGILSAHLHCPDAAWLVLACDMPLVATGLLERLLAARGHGADAIAWRGADGAVEQLCALYEPVTLAAFLAQVRVGGSASPREWLAGSTITVLERPAGLSLAGANTPAEFARLKAAQPQTGKLDG